MSMKLSVHGAACQAESSSLPSIRRGPRACGAPYVFGGGTCAAIVANASPAMMAIRMKFRAYLHPHAARKISDTLRHENAMKFAEVVLSIVICAAALGQEAPVATFGTTVVIPSGLQGTV